MMREMYKNTGLKPDSFSKPIIGAVLLQDETGGTNVS
jgi:hypothetical protein